MDSGAVLSDVHLYNSKKGSLKELFDLLAVTFTSAPVALAAGQRWRTPLGGICFALGFERCFGFAHRCGLDLCFGLGLELCFGLGLDLGFGFGYGCGRS